MMVQIPNKWPFFVPICSTFLGLVQTYRDIIEDFYLKHNYVAYTLSRNYSPLNNNLISIHNKQAHLQHTQTLMGHVKVHYTKKIFY